MNRDLYIATLMLPAPHLAFLGLFPIPIVRAALFVLIYLFILFLNGFNHINFINLVHKSDEKFKYEKHDNNSDNNMISLVLLMAFPITPFFSYRIVTTWLTSRLTYTSKPSIKMSPCGRIFRIPFIKYQESPWPALASFFFNFFIADFKIAH
jgi:hypothetical protein